MSVVVEKVPQNKQEWLNELYRRSKLGLFPAADERGDCRYRTHNGRACAVGILIPDSHYNEVAEGYSGQGIEQAFQECKLPIPEWVTNDEMESVQLVHDTMVDDYGHDDEDWRHQEFINRLLARPVFRGMAVTLTDKPVPSEV